MLLAYIQPAIHQYPQVPFCWAAFKPLFLLPVALHGVVVSQVRDPALGLVVLGPWVQTIQIPLALVLNLVSAKFSEGALDPFVQIADKDI